MASAEHGARIFPAYVSYGTFRNFIEALKETVMPSRIDKTVMTGLSGGAQGHLTSTLKFLGLINANGTPQPALEALVKAAKTNSWPETLRALIEPAYSPVVGDLSLETATPGQLTECFTKNTAVEGATRDKAIRFYLHAAKEAKLDHSPHLAQMKVKTSYSTKARVPKTPALVGGSGATSVSGGESPDSNVVPPGMISYPMYFRRLVNGQAKMIVGSILVPDDLNEQDCKIVAKQLEVLVLSQDIKDTERDLAGK